MAADRTRGTYDWVGVYRRVTVPDSRIAPPSTRVPPPAVTMPPETDYIRHAAKLARKLQADAALGGTPQPDAEFWKTLAKALDQCAEGLAQSAKRE